MSGGGSSGRGDGDWRPTTPEPTESRTGGGGKPGSHGGGGGGRGGEDPCAIHEAATLNSPNRNVVATLRSGDLLDVVFRSGPPRQLLAEHNGSIAGSITSPQSTRIIQCISREGREYVAQVTSVRGGICRVEIRPR